MQLRPALLALLCGFSSAACQANLTDTDESEAQNPYGAEAAEDSVAADDLTAGHRIEGLTAVAPTTRVASQDLVAFLPAGERVPSGTAVTAVRALTFDGVAAYVVVSEASLRSFVVKKTAFDAADPAASRVLAPALASRAGAPINSLFPRDGSTEITLTIDMCQSRKAWDKRLYDWARDVSAATGKPATVGVAMTGGWAKSHPTELRTLMQWQRARELDIVWINHSHTHPLHCNAARTSCAFLTAASVDMRAEIFDNERLLLGQGAVPSVLFRFPGLIHNEARRRELTQASLFAIDADTWLAKGHAVRDGSVILVHGNGNEPPGISRFFSLAQEGDWATRLRTGQMRLASPLQGVASQGN
jgi:hypothetical protein